MGQKHGTRLHTLRPSLPAAHGLTCMTMSGMESGSVQEAPLKATANCKLGWSGSRMRTSLPVKMAGACVET